MLLGKVKNVKKVKRKKEQACYFNGKKIKHSKYKKT